MRILLVEDDKEIGNNLKKILSREAMTVDLAANYQQGFDKGLLEDYDLMILDRMLPDRDGVDLCRNLRIEGVDCPVLMLTARGMNEDITSGLDAGADDYLVKPFEVSVLLARIRALLRRKEAIVQEVYNVGDLIVNISSHQVGRAGKAVNLSLKEHGLLEYLARNANRVIGREELLSHVWDENADAFSNTIDVHIRYLRKKLGVSGDLIKTIRGKGYMLCVA